MTGQHRLPVGPAGQQKEEAVVFDPVEHDMDELERRWIGPVHVLHHHQDRPFLGQPENCSTRAARVWLR